LYGDESGWLIGIEDPEDAGRTVATVRLGNRALGTSSTSNQYFLHEGRRYGHLLDPRTGRPADAVASTSVLAPDAATADALATAFFVAGLDKSAEFCHNHPDIAAVIVLKQTPAGEGAVSNRRGPRVVTFNLSSQDVKIATGGPRTGTS
jgi:thiamine biosynthesis lipoprotein